MLMHIRTLLVTRSRKALILLGLLLLGWATYTNLWWHGGNRSSFEDDLLAMTYLGVFWSVIFIAAWVGGDLQPGIAGQFILRSSDRLGFICKRSFAVILCTSIISILMFGMAAIFAEDFYFSDLRFFIGCIFTGIVYGMISMFFGFLFRSSWLSWLLTFFVLLGLEPLVSKYVSVWWGQVVSPEHYLTGMQSGVFNGGSLLGCIFIVVLMFFGSWVAFVKRWI